MADQTTLLDTTGAPISESNPLQAELGDGTDTLGINADGSIAVGDGTEKLLVNTDGSLSAHVSDGTDEMAVNTDGSLNVVLTDGTNSVAPNADGSLDVILSDGTNALAINADGSLDVVLSDGTHTLDMDANGRIGVIAKDEFTEVARGNVSGSNRKFIVGYNADIQGTEEDVTPAAVVLPAAAASCNVVSSSNNDDASSTGARTVRVWGLNDAGAETSEVVTMTGMVDVATTTLFSRVFGVEALTFGATGASEGTITVKDTTNTYLYASLAAAANITTDCKYTIPTGKTGYLVGYAVNGSSAAAGTMLYRVLATMDPVTGLATAGVFRPVELCVSGANASYKLAVPYKLPAGVDVKVVGKRITGAQLFTVSAMLEIVIE